MQQLQIQQKTPQRIFDSNETSNVGILLIREKTLKEITEKSGPLADRNEFQVHYWALVVRSTYPDGSILDLAFPTVFFNYTQQVNPAHIDFELKDVEDMSIAVKPLHDQLAQNIVDQLAIGIPPKSVVLEYLSVPMNTMHRHPTGVSSFSGTDLSKNHIAETGVVFPLASANETPSFSSIIYNNPVKMVRTEYRIATGSTETEEGIRYRKGRSATVYIQDLPTKQMSMAERLFISEEEIAKSLRPVIINNGIENIPEDLLDCILKATELPNTMFIQADNVSKKEVTIDKDLANYWRDMAYFDGISKNDGRYDSLSKRTDAMIGFDNYLLEDAETVQKIEEKYKLKYYTDDELEGLEKQVLVDTILRVETIYYGKPPQQHEVEDYLSEERLSLAETLSELQYLLYEEARETIL